MAARIIPLVSRFRNSLYLISTSYEFRNRKDTRQPIDASVVLVSKFAIGADIGDMANFETTTLDARGWKTPSDFLTAMRGAIDAPDGADLDALAETMIRSASPC